jgi:hypothetical protein
MVCPVKVSLRRGGSVVAIFRAEKPSQVYEVLKILTQDSLCSSRVAEYAGEVLGRGGQPPMDFTYNGVTIRAEETT